MSAKEFKKALKEGRVEDAFNHLEALGGDPKMLTGLKLQFRLGDAASSVTARLDDKAAKEGAEHIVKSNYHTAMSLYHSLALKELHRTETNEEGQ